MNDIIMTLQNLTNCKSNALLELLEAFEQCYPSENIVKDLLNNYCFSEDKCNKSLVLEALENLKNRRE